MGCLKLLFLALAITQAEGAMMKNLRQRTLAATGVPDPYCKTGIISLPVKGQPKSCCAGYCGACNDYETCESINGQASENACCASKVYEMRCGNAPANVCLKTCSEAVPPCIMDKDVDGMSIPKAKAVKGVPPCNEVVPVNAQRQAAAVAKGRVLSDLHGATSDHQQAIAKAESAKDKLQKDAKKSKLPGHISKKYDAAIKRAETVLEKSPKSMSKVRGLQDEVESLKIGKEMSHSLELKVTGEMDAAESGHEEAQAVKEAAKDLRQEALEHEAKKQDKKADKQADQYAKAQEKASDKEEAAAKAAKEAKEAAEAAAEAKAKEAAKLKAIEEEHAKASKEAKEAAEAAAAAKAKEAAKLKAVAEEKAKEAAKLKAKAEAAAAAKAKEAAKLKAIEEEKAKEAAKLKAKAEAAAAEAKKQEAEKKAAEEKAAAAATKMCSAQLAGLPCDQEWAFVTDSKNNLVAVKKGPKTGSGRTEVHRLTASSNYKDFDIHTATALHNTDSNWDFVMDSKDNLVAIRKDRTGSGMTEVHRLSASSNYGQFDLQIGTGLHQTDENWAFTMDSKDNLVCVLKGPSGSKTTEVHRLSASSNYKSFDLQTATGLDYTYSGANSGEWDFEMDPQDNLVCILKGPNSGSGKTEVHKLSGASNFKDFNLHTSTALHYSTTDWAFAMAGNDVVGVLKGPSTGSCMTEVHKLNGGSNYGQFNLQVGTGLELSAATSCVR